MTYGHRQEGGEGQGQGGNQMEAGNGGPLLSVIKTFFVFKESFLSSSDEIWVSPSNTIWTVSFSCVRSYSSNMLGTLCPQKV